MTMNEDLSFLDSSGRILFTIEWEVMFDQATTCPVAFLRKEPIYLSYDCSFQFSMQIGGISFTFPYQSAKTGKWIENYPV